MPEGPLIVIFKEALNQFTGARIGEAASTLTAVPAETLAGRAIEGFSTWGKYLMVWLSGHQFLRIHWGMFGVYYINEDRPGKLPKLSLFFEDGRFLHFYSVTMQLLEGRPGAEYSPAVDVMSPLFDVAAAAGKLQQQPETMLCDALMDQTVFAGIGNVIKNETLFAQRLHPECTAGSLPAKRLKALTRAALDQTQVFFENRRADNGRHSWALVHRKKICPLCSGPLTKAHTGVLERQSFWCEACQPLNAG